MRAQSLTAARIARKLGLDGGLRFLVNRLHVSTLPAEIQTDITRRVQKSFREYPGPDARALGEDACVTACVTYALMVHAHNSRSYRRVISGRI